MAYYQLGKVIKMRRKALNYRREDIEAGGLCGMTIYRVEEGKTKTTEQTFRNLTRSLGMEESTRQGALKTDNMSDLYLVNDVARVFCEKNAEKAEVLLEEITESVDCSVPRNRQYIEWIRAKLKYRQKKITAAEYEAAIRKALSYTIPGFGEDGGVSLRKWPLHEKELKILIALSNALKMQKKYIEQKELLEEVKYVLDIGYMNQEYREVYEIAILVCLASVLGCMHEHEEAIKIDKEAIHLCTEYQEFRCMSDIYYDIHWNYWEIKKKETLSADEENECRQCLIKAYYMSKIQQVEEEFYKKRLIERYPDELY